MITNNSFLAGIFKETRDFIRNLNPKNCSPPFIINTFLSVRSKAFNKLNETKNKDNNFTETLKTFIENFEGEFVEDLREKLKGRYADYILQKRYNLPSNVNFKDLKDLGAIEEINQICEAVAEWSLELEIFAYTLEGLKLYGLQDFKGVEKRDYVSELKHAYTFNKKTSFGSISEYIVRKIVSFSLARFSSIALVRGFTKVQLGIGTILEIFYIFSMSNQVPWALILSYLNLPWVVGGLACSLALGKLNDYVLKDETLKNLKEVYLTFENNKLYLMSERKNLLDVALKIASKDPDERSSMELKKLTKLIDNLLSPKEEAESEEILDEQTEMMFDVKDQDDVVLVEEKDHKELVDDSGVVVVDF